MSDTLSTGPFDHFPRCAFGVGGLDFSCVAVLSIVAVVAVTGFFHMSLLSLKESHVARGIGVVSFSFSPASISRNQRSREISLNFFLNR